MSFILCCFFSAAKIFLCSFSCNSLSFFEHFSFSSFFQAVEVMTYDLFSVLRIPFRCALFGILRKISIVIVSLKMPLFVCFMYVLFLAVLLELFTAGDLGASKSILLFDQYQ